MARVYCQRHGPPHGTRHRYRIGVRPIGYPNKGVLCCKKGCGEPGLVWLNGEDEANYNSGEREIVIWGQSVKVGVV